MSLTYRRRVPLYQGRRVEIWANLRLGIPSLSFRLVKRASFNTRNGFTSFRFGRGFSWRDRD